MDFQIYVLTYLTGEERRQQKLGTVFGRSDSGVGFTYTYRSATI